MKTLPFLAIAAIAGGAATLYLAPTLFDSAPASITSPQHPGAAPSGDPVAALQARLTELEATLQTEIAARQQLQLRIDRLLADDESAVFIAEDEVSAPAAEEPSASPWESRRLRNSEQARLDRLQEAGFPAGQAAWILEREQEIQLEALHRQWRERREQFLSDPTSMNPALFNPLRAELGDQAYERYLEANGRPTGVRVARLMEGSPAELAGLQIGDEIVSYDGQRVYGLGDLNGASVRGDQGQVVLVDVMREGNRIQLAIERGPLGIITRRGGR